MADNIGNKAAHDYHLDVPVAQEGFYVKGGGIPPAEAGGSRRNGDIPEKKAQGSGRPGARAVCSSL